MSNWIVRFNDKGMQFTSQYARATFLEYRKKNKYGKFKLSPHDKLTPEQRGYYFGAVIEAYIIWSDNYDIENTEHLAQVHEIFKVAFNGSIMTGLQGKPIRVGKSTTNLNKKEYSAFLGRVEAYFDENQIPWPDAELYKLYVDKYYDQFTKYRDWLKSINMNCDGSPIELN